RHSRAASATAISKYDTTRCRKRRRRRSSKIMSIKRILVPLPASVDHTGEVETALPAAKALGAHVEALFISQPPTPTPLGASVSEMVGARTAAVAEERERAAREARERFASACAATGIPVLSADDQRGAPPVGFRAGGGGACV